MIRDYPDTMPNPVSPPPSSSGTPVSSTTSSPNHSVINLPSVVSPPATPTISSFSSTLIPPSAKSGPVLPPPRHPSQGPVQTTYTPYIPRNRRRGLAPSNASSPLSPTGQQIPIITSSSQGGVTTRHPVSSSASRQDGHPNQHSSASSSTGKHDTGPSAALLDRVRALDALPRLGALRTLDLKGNDLRVSGDGIYPRFYRSIDVTWLMDW